jgi:hypothetical protein
MNIVSPFFVFPPIGWWVHIVGAQIVLFEKHEHYQKMTDRNRYKISGANNSVLLSIPLENGRNQHIPMAEVRIKNEQRWQTQHWRTIVSVYNRSPYFYHYKDSLQSLFEQEYTCLIDFNKASVQWVKQQLKLNFLEMDTESYQKQYSEQTRDLRQEQFVDTAFPAYYQVFEDRIGFIQGLSILDLLFSEGPNTIKLLKSHHSKSLQA